MKTVNPALLALSLSACVRKGLIDSFKYVRGRRATHSKKLPKTVVVRLLKAVQSYGDEGTLVPVSPGRMRNIWFPQRMADYLTIPELMAVKKKQGLLSIQRDFNFGKDWEKEEVKNEANYGTVAGLGEPSRRGSIIEGLQLSPQRTSDLLRVLVPTKLQFQRQPIHAQASTDSTTDSNATTSPTKPSQVTDASIYGSVSALDILNLIRSVLANNEEGSRITLSEDNIHFLNMKGDGDKRLKHLGEFLINISVNGMPDGQYIKKIIKISPIFENIPETEKSIHV